MYVAIGRDMLEETRTKIRRMAELEEAASPTPLIMIDNPSTPFAMQLIWGDRQHLRDQIPDTWLHSLERTRIKPSLNGEQFSLEVRFTRAVNVPVDLSTYNHAPREIDAATFPEVMASIDAARQRAAISQRWNAVRMQVLGFLEQCKSLNEALKLFPNIKPYIPEKYIERVNMKAEKKVRDTTNIMGKLASIDTDMLAASAVLSRLAGNK